MPRKKQETKKQETIEVHVKENSTDDLTHSGKREFEITVTVDAQKLALSDSIADMKAIPSLPTMLRGEVTKTVSSYIESGQTLVQKAIALEQQVEPDSPNDEQSDEEFPPID